MDLIVKIGANNNPKDVSAAFSKSCRAKRRLKICSVPFDKFFTPSNLMLNQKTDGFNQQMYSQFGSVTSFRNNIFIFEMCKSII